MFFCPICFVGRKENSLGHLRRFSFWMLSASLFLTILLVTFPVFGQEQAPAWQAQVRKYCEARDWEAALRIVDQEIVQTPQDTDVRAWRARVLSWSGHLVEAQRE